MTKYHCANFAGYRSDVVNRIIIVYSFNIIFIGMKRFDWAIIAMAAIKREKMAAVGNRLAVKPKSWPGQSGRNDSRRAR